MPLITYSDDERHDRIEAAIIERYSNHLNWEEIGDKLRIARSTLTEWRKLDEWKETETLYRKMLREQTRGRISSGGDRNVEVLEELRDTARSDYVRYMAATRLLEFDHVGDELEENAMDQHKELQDFLLKEHRRQIQAPTVLPGGLLPPALQIENEAYRVRKQQEQEAYEAEFRAVSSSDDEDDETTSG